MISALITVFPRNEFVSEPHACLGVEFQLPGGAPNRKFFHCEIDLLDNSPLAFEVLAKAIGLLQPLIEGER